jgi:phosphotransferase system  glucose/maltose/N-acetylglucosamine-specific IIC component
MLIALAALLMLSGAMCAMFPRTRFLSLYLALIPVFVLAGATLSFVLSAWFTNGENHMVQATTVKWSFFAGVLLGAVIAVFISRWLNRRLGI